MPSTSLYVNVLPSASWGMTAPGAAPASAGSVAWTAWSRPAAQAGKPAAVSSGWGMVAATSDGAPWAAAPAVIFSPSTPMLCIAGLSSMALMIWSVFWLRTTGSNSVVDSPQAAASATRGSTVVRSRRDKDALIVETPRVRDSSGDVEPTHQSVACAAIGWGPFRYPRPAAG